MEPAPAATAKSDASMNEKSSIWTKDELPESVDYYRMWTYSASAQSEDPAILAKLIAAIQALQVGEKSEWVTEDYTDILTFSFADGETLRLEFENQCWVTANDERYEVEGLDNVRAILDELMHMDTAPEYAVDGMSFRTDDLSGNRLYPAGETSAERNIV